MKVSRTSKRELRRFRDLVRVMTRDSLIYRMLKEELKAQGHWKNLKRGKPGGIHSMKAA